MSSIVPVVLSGGAGTRLWPLSRRDQPKQFHSLIGDGSLLEQTLVRVESFKSSAMIVGSVSQVEQLAAHGHGARVIAEPAARNTAPAVAAAALLAEPDDILAVMPADHHISEPASFQRALAEAISSAEHDYLTAFGVVPERAETGYGYIVPRRSESPPWPIDRFVEKPDPTTAARLIEEGALWNSGMFVFPVGLLLEELGRFVPELLASVRAAVASSTNHPYGVALGDEFREAPSLSIDVAVMERTGRAAVIPLAAGWSDIGSFATLWELGEKDRARNVIVGPVTAINATGSYLRSEGPRLAVSGVADLVIVATDSGILVTSRQQAQTVKDLFALLDPGER